MRTKEPVAITVDAMQAQADSDMRYALDIESLSKHYDGFELRDVNIKVEPGRVVGLVGSNGAGKTTTLKATLGIIEADEGSIHAFGHPVTPDSSLTDEAKARIGVVLDSCAFPESYRVKDVAALGKTAYPTWSQQTWNELVERFELPPDKTTEKLSRGMGMKLSLAFALSHAPDLLILDEATAGLDPMARDDVLDILREFMMEASHSILISSHITTDLERIADEIVCLDEGRVVFAVEKDAITDEAGIARLRESELEAVLESPMLASSDARFARHEHWVDLLVPDRFAFARAFPDIVVDRATVEEYMTLMLRGASR